MRLSHHRRAAGVAPACLLILSSCNAGQPASSSSPSVAPSSSRSGAVEPRPQPRPAWDDGVSIHLARRFEGGSLVSFGLPVPPAAVEDPASVRVLVAATGRGVPAVTVKPILFGYSRTGTRRGIRALLIQFPARAMAGGSMDIRVAWKGGAGSAPGTGVRPYAEARQESPEVARVADWRIERTGAGYELVERNPSTRTLYVGWEPRVLATYPPGYLAATGILGEQMSRGELLATPVLAGLVFLSDYLERFADGAMHRDDYRLSRIAVPDTAAAYEAWLYDRCATFLTAYAHLGHERHLRHALRACSFYASMIDPAGMFTLKRDDKGASSDAKYSHVRGLYAYYALTGDELALEAGANMAHMWRDEPLFVAPYRKGAARAADKLWTERLLGASLEGLVYGFLLTGERDLLKAAGELFETAYRHVTTADQAELDSITRVHFPPQNCFVHSGEQHDGGKATEPWCSGWMAELVIDPLLRYQELTGDGRVDEIFVRLVRALRDVGLVYFRGNPRRDSFLEPSLCYDPAGQGDSPRILNPLEGFGIRPDGTRAILSEWDDFQHCADATALTAAGIRALVRQGRWRGGGVGPFATEGESFVALHHELAHCALRTFRDHARPGRAPAAWRSDDLAEGYAEGDEEKQARFIEKRKIGFPVHQSAPARKLSWWFNTSMLQFRLLGEAADRAAIDFRELRPGAVQPPGGCPRSTGR